MRTVGYSLDGWLYLHAGMVEACVAFPISIINIFWRQHGLQFFDFSMPCKTPLRGRPFATVVTPVCHITPAVIVIVVLGTSCNIASR